MNDSAESSFRYIESGSQKIAELKPEIGRVEDVRQALDLMAEAAYAGAPNMLLRAEQLPSSFFDLSTGLAGEILQKFAQYQVRLAIIGDFSQYKSKALKAFIAESNRGSQIFFVADIDEGMQRLTNQLA